LQMDTVAAGTEDMLVDVAGQLAGVGVTYLYGGVLRPVDTRAEFVSEVRRMGETLVPRIAAIDATGRVGTGGDGGRGEAP